MDLIISFLAGGILCVIAQILIDKTSLTPAKILVFYVVAGVLLTAIGFYDRFVDIAGAGATVPLTGFGYSLAKGTEKAISRDGFPGILTGGLSACSAGIAAAVFFGAAFSLVSQSRPK